MVTKIDIPVNAGPARHLKALDGFRGIAILMVVLFHALFLRCGWIGVQIFFVLSGFLITSILLNDSDLPLGLYMKRFYWRRTLRIFPLYYGYLLVLALVYVITKHPETFRRDWLFLFTYTLNFRNVLSPEFGRNVYYGRFWSLAVEEQFYLTWPLLVYLLPRKHLLKFVLATIAICPLLRAIAAYALVRISHDFAAAGAALYSLTPCQLDTFATGAAIVLLGTRLRGRSGTILACCTVALLVCGQVNALVCTGKLALNSSFGYGINMLRGGQGVWGYTLINFWAGAGILVASSRNWLSTTLGHPALAYIGKVSYGMYIYHQTIQYAIFRMLGPRHGLENLAAFLFYFLVLVTVSGLSYRYYESWFLALKDTRFQRPRPVELSVPLSPEGAGIQPRTAGLKYFQSLF